jgi:ferrous iron transport protein A
MVGGPAPPGAGAVQERTVGMMPLTMAREGEQNAIKKVGGKAETRQFLENLGFVPGSLVTIVTEISGNVIVSIKESRVALSREMARHILV